MRAYKHVTGNGQSPVFILGDKAFYLVELSAEEEKTLKEEALYDKYYIEFEWEFECHADNDGGIDAWDYGTENYNIAAEESILLNGKVIGFYSQRQIFLIDRGTIYAGGRGDESVGGWGDVSSSSSYTLRQKTK